ncbi:MAG: branched-chain amino acid aminotransferase [Sphingobacteriales bacterium]|nr:MAG: branched-chain amino acid aminotransferase [Sphingobacteriales bacterium]
MEIKISKTSNSRAHELKRDEIVFGQEYADHMLVCDYKDGQWGTPEIVPFGNISICPSLSALHYGQSIFEGVKAYRQPNGGSAIFRPEKNWERFNKSAKRLGMPEISSEIFLDGLRALINVDDAWIPNEADTSLYIRPFMFATDEFLGVRSSLTYKFMIITSPAGPYYNKPVSIYVQSSFVRAVAGGIGFTKAAGNYGASMYPTAEVRKMGYDQILWTDAFEHKYVQEIGTMNVFFIVDGKAITPDLNAGTILAGVTRDSVIALLEENGIPVETANNEITCEISGNARLLGIEAGNNQDMGDYTDNIQHAFHGKMIVYIQCNKKSADEIIVRLTAPGLKQATVKPHK